MDTLSKIKTAVVILNYNGAHHLKKFLTSVIANSPQNDVAIIVADNASTDNSTSYLEESYPSVQIIKLKENYGFAGGYNKCLEQVDAEYYILLNSDVEVSENWIEPVINYMDNNPEVAACQPKILSYNNKKQFEYAGAAGGYLDKYAYPFCRGRILGECENDTNQYNSIEEIFWASGACLFIRKKEFWSAGGFDNTFFAHMEEIDLCWRLKSRGKRISCVPQSTVYHLGGGTLSTDNPRKTFLNFRNNLLMIYKNIPSSRLKQVLFVRWFMDYLSALQMFLSGKKENALSVINARKDFKNKKNQYKYKRKENLEKSIDNSPVGLFNISIVYQYYLRNNKRFYEISKFFN